MRYNKIEIMAIAALSNNLKYFKEVEEIFQKKTIICQILGHLENLNF